MKQKNSEPVPQIAHFEKLSLCSGGNLYIHTLPAVNYFFQRAASSKLTIETLGQGVK